MVLPPSNVELLEPLRQRLSELGWTEGKNLTIEYRFGEGKGPGRLAELAADLVRLNLDLIVVTSTSGALAAKQATRSIPIVMCSVADPIGQGIIASLARPGGNITGLASLAEDLGGKRLEILKEAIPRASLIAVFMGSERGQGVEAQTKLMKTAAPALGLKLELFGVIGEPQRLENAFQTVARNGFHALIATSGAAMFAERKRIAMLAVKYRLPGIYPQREFVEEGGLLSYGIDRPSQYRHAATYVDKILNGAPRSVLPGPLRDGLPACRWFHLWRARGMAVSISPRTFSFLLSAVTDSDAFVSDRRYRIHRCAELFEHDQSGFDSRSQTRLGCAEFSL
jgi:putative ABC transport system substrate-binding protein